MYIVRIIAPKTAALGTSPRQVVARVRAAAPTVGTWRLVTAYARLVSVSYSDVCVKGSLRLC